MDKLELTIDGPKKVSTIETRQKDDKVLTIDGPEKVSMMENMQNGRKSIINRRP